MRHVDLSNVGAALTERLADRRSTARAGLSKPCEHDRLLAAVVGEAIRPAVGPYQAEVRRHLTDRRRAGWGAADRALISGCGDRAHPREKDRYHEDAHRCFPFSRRLAAPPCEII